MDTSHDLRLLRSPMVWLCAVAGALVLAISPAQAAGTPDQLTVPDGAGMSARQAYEHDRAFCNSDQATQPRALCLKEAQRAYEEARRGLLQTGQTMEPTSAGRRDLRRDDNAAPKN